MNYRLDEVIRGLSICPPYGQCENEDCPYYEYNDCLERLQTDALSLLQAQNEVIQALLKVGYPHGFYLEEPWVVSYMYAITDVIKKAVNLNNERFAGKDDSGTGRSENNLLDYTRR